MPSTPRCPERPIQGVAGGGGFAGPGGAGNAGEPPGDTAYGGGGFPGLAGGKAGASAEKGGFGGGSFDCAGLDQILAAGVQSGNGEVIITELASGSALPAVPEPSSWAMSLTGFAALAGLVAMRRRSKA